MAFFAPVVHPSLSTPQLQKHRASIAAKSMGMLNDMLSQTESSFLHGEVPTLSDLICYGEVGQLSPRFLDVHDFTLHRHLSRWMTHMEELPHFEAAHEDLLQWLPHFQRLREQVP